MTRDQAILIILKRLGQRQSDAVLQEACVTEMAEAQKRLERGDFYPWFLLSEVMTVYTVENEERLTVPSNFLGEYEEGSIWYHPADGVKLGLLKDDMDVLMARYAGQFGAPVAYTVSGGYFRLFPTPNAAYKLTSQFYLSEPLIEEPYEIPGAITTNNWLQFASDWLIAETGVYVAKYHTRDAEAAGAFALDAQKAKKETYFSTVARFENARTRSMGDA